MAAGVAGVAAGVAGVAAGVAGVAQLTCSSWSFDFEAGSQMAKCTWYSAEGVAMLPYESKKATRTAEGSPATAPARPSPLSTDLESSGTKEPSWTAMGEPTT